MTDISHDVIYEVLSKTEGQSPVKIARQFKDFPLVEVRQILRQMVKDDRARYDGDDFDRLYFRVEK